MTIIKNFLIVMVVCVVCISCSSEESLSQSVVFLNDDGLELTLDGFTLLSNDNGAHVYVDNSNPKSTNTITITSSNTNTIQNNNHTFCGITSAQLEESKQVSGVFNAQVTINSKIYLIIFGRIGSVSPLSRSNVESILATCPDLSASEADEADEAGEEETGGADEADEAGEEETGGADEADEAGEEETGGEDEADEAGEEETGDEDEADEAGEAETGDEDEGLSKFLNDDGLQLTLTGYVNITDKLIELGNESGQTVVEEGSHYFIDNIDALDDKGIEYKSIVIEIAEDDIDNYEDFTTEATTICGLENSKLATAKSNESGAEFIAQVPLNDKLYYIIFTSNSNSFEKSEVLSILETCPGG